MKQKLLEPPLTAGLAPLLHIPYLIAKNVGFFPFQSLIGFQEDMYM